MAFSPKSKIRYLPPVSATTSIPDLFTCNYPLPPGGWVVVLAAAAAVVVVFVVILVVVAVIAKAKAEAPAVVVVVTECRLQNQ